MQDSLPSGYLYPPRPVLLPEQKEELEKANRETPWMRKLDFVEYRTWEASGKTRQQFWMDSKRRKEIPFSEIKKIVVFYEPNSSGEKIEVMVGLLFFIYDTKLKKYCYNFNDLNVESMWSFRKSIWEKSKITFGDRCFDVLWGDNIKDSDDARKKFEKSISDFEPLEHVDIQSQEGSNFHDSRDKSQMLIKEWESQNEKKETKQG